MFWTQIIGIEYVDPSNVADDVKINSPAYVEFLTMKPQFGLRKKTLALTRAVIRIKM